MIPPLCLTAVQMCQLQLCSAVSSARTHDAPRASVEPAVCTRVQQLHGAPPHHRNATTSNSVSATAVETNGPFVAHVSILWLRLISRKRSDFYLCALALPGYICTRCDGRTVDAYHRSGNSSNLFRSRPWGSPPTLGSQLNTRPSASPWCVRASDPTFVIRQSCNRRDRWFRLRGAGSRCACPRGRRSFRRCRRVRRHTSASAGGAGGGAFRVNGSGVPGARRGCCQVRGDCVRGDRIRRGACPRRAGAGASNNDDNKEEKQEPERKETLLGYCCRLWGRFRGGWWGGRWGGCRKWLRRLEGNE